VLRQLAAASPAAAALGGGAGLPPAASAAVVDLSAVTQRWDGFTAALQQVGTRGALHPPPPPPLP
jgi:hypothetical protein